MHNRLVYRTGIIGVALAFALGTLLPLRAITPADYALAAPLVATPSPVPTSTPPGWLEGQDRGPELPASACGLVSAQVVCYDGYRATPHPATPPTQQIIDFAIAPDGNWIVYRAANVVTIAPVAGSSGSGVSSASQPVDAQAAPPAELSLTSTTLAWSPDGITIAYVTANGFRAAFPTPDGGVRLVEVTDRAAVNLRFSPGGGRLAVQSDDGSWTLFAVHPAGDETGQTGETGEQPGLQRTRLIDQAADVAWLDDTSLIVAPVAGGLMRLDASDPALGPAWTVPGEHFTKLFTTSTGQVLALHPDPGDTIGSVVAIDGGGTVQPLGESKIDSMAEWGPDGAMMYYITSGTPILIDRATGDEDMLPLKQITRLIWDAPGPTPVSSLPLDADLYFAAPGASGDSGDSGVRQVWRLPRSGLELAAPVTRLSADVQDYAISQEGSRLIVRTASGQTVITLTGTPIPAAQGIPPAATPNLRGVRLSVESVQSAASTQPSQPGQPGQPGQPAQSSQSARAWVIRSASGSTLVQSPWPILDLVVGAGGTGAAGNSAVRFVRRVGWPLGPDSIRLFAASTDPARPEARGPFGILSSPRLSPSGRFAAGVEGSGAASQLVILDLQTGRKVLLRDVNGVSLIKWVS